jgi:hypothetical protein
MKQSPSLETNIAYRFIRKLPAFYGIRISLSCSQEPATGLYSEPVQLNVHPHIPFFQLNIILPFSPFVPKW